MFFGKIKANTGRWPCWKLESCIPRIDLSNKVLCMSNKDRIPKLRPREVDVPIYPNGVHSFGASSPRVRFLDVYGFPLFLNNKYASEPHCNTVQRHAATTSLLKDKLPSSELFNWFCLYEYFQPTCTLKTFITNNLVFKMNTLCVYYW